jgi:signal transduction histidine kinase
MLAGKIPPGIHVVRDYDRSLPAILLYAAELNQAWTNLIDNAVSAMGEAGMLTVRTGLDRDHVFVEIRDTDPGVPPEIRERVFEPFFTTKPVGQGTGLGLNIAWRIVVSKHHGNLQVESVPGNTRFQVWLPVNPADESEYSDEPGDKPSRHIHIRAASTTMLTPQTRPDQSRAEQTRPDGPAGAT